MKDAIKISIILLCAFLFGAFIYLGTRVAKELWPDKTIKVEYSHTCGYKSEDC